MKTMTRSQDLRSEAKDSSGRFIKNPCDCCGKPAPMDSYSDERCNKFGGYGITLRLSCANRLAKLTDAEFEAEAKAKA
jgi:hypothetical protein